MTLHFEIMRPGTEEIMKKRIFQPGEGSTVSNNLPDGNRELLIFECDNDNLHSTLTRSSANNDILLSRTERFVPLSRQEGEVKILNPDQPLTLQVVTDRGTIADIRLTHKIP